MLPDALSQLFDTLHRLPHLDAGQLRELIQHLPDPQAAAQEMVRRGWITQDQFASLFPGPRQPCHWQLAASATPPQEMMPLGFGDDETTLDADGEDWSLTLSDEDDEADVPPGVEWAWPDRTEAEMRPEPEAVEAVPVAGGNEAHWRESDTDKPLGQPMVWAIIGLLMGTLFLGCLFAGVQLFVAHSRVPPGAPQGPREAKAGSPAGAVALPTLPPIVSIGDVKQRFDLVKDVLNGTGQNAPPAPPVVAEVPAPPPAPVAAEPPAPAKAPVTAPPVAAEAPAPAKAPARPNDARPKTKASLYARVRQVVRENKTEETLRLGIGDVAYQNVPEDGSILVGMEATYVPFFNQNVIKSVRPIYQREDGTRYDGPVCGTPTKVRERVVAKEGYAIGGAAMRAGLGIGGIQLTFMEIGPDGLNPNKTYLSKWLGTYGTDARMYLNDGRPIVGIAGMASSKPQGPAFCMCLVTTQADALATADGRGYERPPPTPRNSAITASDGQGNQPPPPTPRSKAISIINGTDQNTPPAAPAAPAAEPGAALPVIIQGPPRPPQQQESFEQRVRRQMREAQQRMRQRQR
jgi:hypothetical protein